MNVQAITGKSAVDRAGAHPCRLCGSHVAHTFVDLGMSPLCESFLLPDQLDAMEPYFPLRAGVCGECFLVQLNEYVRPRAHLQRIRILLIVLHQLGRARQGLLREDRRAPRSGRRQPGRRARQQRRLPAAALSLRSAYPCSALSRPRTSPRLRSKRAFRRASISSACALAAKLAAEGRKADLIAGNNVLAQVPDLNDFVAGMRILLEARGRRSRWSSRTCSG